MYSLTSVTEIAAPTSRHPEVELDASPNSWARSSGCGPCGGCGYAAGGVGSVTTKCLSNTLSVWGYERE